ncbi:MAG: hypothetical protein QOE91_1474, partial [Gaiellaceae bacterium]|nr:hypothetical protein [Gaiellaceae bacterium]
SALKSLSHRTDANENPQRKARLRRADITDKATALPRRPTNREPRGEAPEEESEAIRGITGAAPAIPH